MVVKQSIPAWSAIVAIVLVLALLIGYFMTTNFGGASRDTLIRLRTKPGSSPAASAGGYGMPRGTPVIHNDGTQAGGTSRQKPGQG